MFCVRVAYNLALQFQVALPTKEQYIKVRNWEELCIGFLLSFEGMLKVLAIVNKPLCTAVLHLSVH